MAEPVDYSKTERIVLVIDLRPVFALQNPKSYLNAVVCSIKRLLNFPPLCNSLFAYRLFFSSLPPLRSASVVHRLLPHPTLTSLSFDCHSQTLISLLKVLDSLSASPIVDELLQGRPLASHTAGSLLQLVHDYYWEGKGNNHFPHVRSNLIVLFSPICHLDVDEKPGASSGSHELLQKFRDVFGGVIDSFTRRHIHFSWVNVMYDVEGSDSKTGYELGLFEKVMGNFGCGFCSTDSVVLGSALVPFRLIYPKIGVPFELLNVNGSYRLSDVQLNLGILDVNSNPLECNCCNLELLNLNTLHGQKSDGGWSSVEFGDLQSVGFGVSETFWDRFSDGTVKLSIKAVQKFNEGEKIAGVLPGIILVKELSGASKRRKKGSSDEHFADRIIDILSTETDGVSNRSPVPIWQIILSFLCSEGYSALVSLANSKGDEVPGILKPFTAHSALLSILSDDCHRDEVCSASLINKVQDLCVEPSNSNGLVSSQTETSGDCGTEKEKKNKKKVYRDLTWASFQKAALECSDLDLSEIYFARKFEKDKKLMFLKCWMKQIMKYSQQSIQRLHASKSTENENPRSPKSSFEQPEKPDEARMVLGSETTETFFNKISERIQLGLESGVNVQTLAEQLVKSSINWLIQGGKREENSVVQYPEEDSCESICAKLMKLLLSDPKEMNCVGEECSDPSSKSFNPNLSEGTLRRYELQVFLRMEILRPGILTSVQEPLKQKLLKQICSFLDIIQYLIEGGIHGNISLYDYVERTIKARYSDVLEDTVKDIYNKMDLLPFGEEDETRAFLFNSEDSSHSWRDKEMQDESESQDIHKSVSLEDETHDLGERSSNGTSQEEPERKLSEARARRERARRFGSFTSWLPDLQRVWAPKPHKEARGKSDSLRKDSKRRNMRTGSCSVVCETPVSGRKRPYSRQNGEGDEEWKSPGNQPNSVSKALFQDD